MEIDAGFILIREELTNIFSSVAQVVLRKDNAEEFERRFQWISWVLTFTAVGLLLSIFRQSGFIPKFFLTSIKSEEDEQDELDRSFNDNLLHDDRKSTTEFARIPRNGSVTFPGKDVDRRGQRAKPDGDFRLESNFKMNGKHLEVVGVASDFDFGRLDSLLHERKKGDIADGREVTGKKNVEVFYLDDPNDRKN